MYILIVILSVFVSALAQMLLKKAATMPHKSLIWEYLNIRVVAGYFLMGCSLVANIFAMSRGIQAKEVNIVESLGFLFVPALSFMFFKEKISLRKIISIIIILSGVILFFI